MLFSLWSVICIVKCSGKESFGNNSTNLQSVFGENATLVRDPSALQHIFVTWTIVETLLVTTTNSLTLIILWRYAGLEIPSNIFIAWLTFSDLFGAVLSPFDIATIYLTGGRAWTIACFGSILIGTILYFNNAAALCAISIDRLIFIKYALEYHTIFPVKKAIRIVWTITVVTVGVVVLCCCIGYQAEVHEETTIGSCIYFLRLTYSSRVVLAVPYCLLQLITIGCYIQLGIIAYRQKRAIGTTEAPTLPNQIVESDFKIAKVMFTILLVFVGCNVMLSIQPILFGNLDSQKSEQIIRLLNCVWRINMWVNPIIYVWKSKRFREHVNKFLKDIPGAMHITCR